MKKIKIIFVVVLTFFSLCLTTSSHAQTEEAQFVKIYEKTEVDYNNTKVLNQGYYIFGSLYGEAFSEKNFVGDLSTHFVPSGTNEITTRDFKNTLGIELDETFFQERLIEPFMTTFGKNEINENGVYFVRVYSYGAFTTAGGSFSNVTAYGLCCTSPNETQDRAGNKTHIVNVDHPISIEEIKSRYQAVDNVDKDITSKITFDTNYYKNHFDIGTYYVYVTITDENNNTATAMDTIQVIDFVPPQLNLSKEVHEIEVHTPFTTKEAKAFFSATDNFSTGWNLGIYFTDLYQDQYNTVGTYTISAYARDHGLNRSETKELEIRVVDTTKPVISLAAGGDTIISNRILTENEIKALLQVTDNYYSISNQEIEIKSNTCNGDQGVEFQIVAQVRDGSGNLAENTFKYYLTDTTAPIILVKKTIYIPLGTTYTNDQIIQMLKDAGIISQDATHVDLTSTITSFDQEGIHQLSYVETLPDGTTQEGTANLAIFRPVEATKSNSNSSISPWYYVLFILPVVLVIPFLILKKKHEKN